MSRPKRQQRTDRGRPGPATEREIIDGLQPVCICKGIRKNVFLKYIRAGASTLQALQQATGAGSGSCKGKRCTKRILDLLSACGASGPDRTPPA